MITHTMHANISDLWIAFVAAAGYFGAHAPAWTRPLAIAEGQDPDAVILAEIERVHALVDEADAADREEHGPGFARERYDAGYVGDDLVVRFGGGRSFARLVLADPPRLEIGLGEHVSDVEGGRVSCEARHWAAMGEPLHGVDGAYFAQRREVARAQERTKQ